MNKLNHIELELTNYCNLSCWMCPRKKMNRDVGFMKVDLVRKLMNDFSKAGTILSSINLHLFGESILHPDLNEILSILRSHTPGIFMSFSTNASFLTLDSFKKIEHLLDNLFIAIDGITEDTYRRHRGVELQTVLDNLSPVFDYRKKGNIVKPKFEIRMIELGQSETEKEDFINYFKELVLDSDVVSFKPIVSYAGSVDELNHIRYSQCPYLLSTKTAIHWNGKVTTCCFDANCVNYVGDINEANLVDIFNSEKYNQYRKAYENGTIKSLSTLCNTCLEDNYNREKLIM